MHFVDWKPLKVRNRPRYRSVNLPIKIIPSVTVYPDNPSLVSIRVNFYKSSRPEFPETDTEISPFYLI